MSTKNSTLELFAIRSYVSVLPETEKETALKIVGGGGGDDDGNPNGMNICDPDDREMLNDWFDFHENEGFHPWIEIDDGGNIIDYGLDGRDDNGPGDHIYDSHEWKNYPCYV